MDVAIPNVNREPERRHALPRGHRRLHAGGDVYLPQRLRHAAAASLSAAALSHLGDRGQLYGQRHDSRGRAHRAVHRPAGGIRRTQERHRSVALCADCAHPARRYLAESAPADLLAIHAGHLRSRRDRRHHGLHRRRVSAAPMSAAPWLPTLPERCWADSAGGLSPEWSRIISTGAMPSSSSAW